MSETKEMKLHGRILITGTIKAVTGLHIGTSEGAISIGGVDNVIVRDPLTQRPYIPGSSLKGKMRSLLEKSDGRPQNRRIGQATIHTCETRDDYAACDVCHIYGVPGELDFAEPTRLVVRDVPLGPESVEALNKAKTDLPYSEVKWEVAIDRITSAAVPRQMERAPAGSEFRDFELVFTLYESADAARFGRLLDSMSLLEDDYLGGSGTRGSGKIAFKQMTVTLKSSDDYLNPSTRGPYATLTDLAANLDEITTLINTLIQEG